MDNLVRGAIPPMIVPFKENGDVDYAACIENIEKWNKTRVSGYLAIGSNSEACYLSKEEKLEIVRITAKHKSEDKILIVGSGAESTRETINLTNQCAKIGADYALILSPFFFKSQMTDEAIIKHYIAVADNCEIPILIYNVPKFTGLNISSSVIKVLCNHKNIIGAKDSMGDIVQLGEYVEAVEGNGEILVGTAGLLYPALEKGIRAGIMALANIAPEQTSEIINLYVDGKEEDARNLWQKMVPVNKAVTADFGVPGLKYAMELVGMKGGYVRSPLLEIGEEEKLELREILKTANMI